MQMLNELEVTFISGGSNDTDPSPTNGHEVDDRASTELFLFYLPGSDDNPGGYSDSPSTDAYSEKPAAPDLLNVSIVGCDAGDWPAAYDAYMS